MGLRTFHLVVSTLLLAIALLFSGCSSQGRQKATAKVTLEFWGEESLPNDPLRIPRLTGDADRAPADPVSSSEVVVIVHPAYSLFFRDPWKDKGSYAKFSLLKSQYENEAAAIENLAATGQVVVIVVPGNFTADSIAPKSFVAYLNRVTAAGQSMYYVFSETSSSGTLPTGEMVNFFAFLQKVNAKKVLIGGGYIGRCQREFHNQLKTYLGPGSMPIVIVPEYSTISPDDISDSEARYIVSRIRQQDYTPVVEFIDKKTRGQAEVQSIPQKKEM